MHKTRLSPPRRSPVSGIGPTLLLVLTGIASCRDAGPTEPTASPPAPVIPEDPEPSSRLILFYDEQMISDAARARLLEVIARAVPRDNWPAVPIEPLDGITTIVDRHLDLYGGSEQGSAPEAARAAVEAVRETNGLVGDELRLREIRQLRLPPVPVRGKSLFAPHDVRTRAFRPEDQSYAVGRVYDELVFESRSFPSTAASLEEAGLRDAHLTAIELTYSDALRDAIAEMGDLLGPELMIMSGARFARVQLFGEPSPCTPFSEWTGRSYYRRYLEQQALSRSAEDKQRLIEAAKATPLVLLDWNFHDPGAHGFKVHQVALHTLKQIGLDTELGQVITDSRIELEPRHGRPRLERLLRDYKASRSFRPEVVDSQTFRNAEKWLDDNDSHTVSSSNEFDVPELLLQAIIWQVFHKHPSWANMSFTILSRGLDVATPFLIRSDQGFAALAAGNDAREISRYGVPQSAATRFPNFVNVTYGASDGTILGRFSSPHEDLPVTAIAPGCGSPLLGNDGGSSYAAPHVAVATWVHHLLTKTQPDRMKAHIIDASVLHESVENKVESQGLFDMALLLGTPGVHLVNGKPEVVPLREATLSIELQLDEPGHTLTRTLHAHDDVATTFVRFFAANGVPFALMRFRDSNGDISYTRGRIREMTFFGVPDDGSSAINLEGAAVIAGSIRFLAI